MLPDPQKKAIAESRPISRPEPGKTSRGYQVHLVTSDPPLLTITYPTGGLPVRMVFSAQEGCGVMKVVAPKAATTLSPSAFPSGSASSASASPAPTPTPTSTLALSALDSMYRTFKAIDKALSKADVFLILVIVFFYMVKRFRAMNSRFSEFLKRSHFHYEKRFVASYGTPPLSVASLAPAPAPQIVKNPNKKET